MFHGRPVLYEGNSSRVPVRLYFSKTRCMTVTAKITYLFLKRSSYLECSWSVRQIFDLFLHLFFRLYKARRGLSFVPYCMVCFFLHNIELTIHGSHHGLDNVYSLENQTPGLSHFSSHNFGTIPTTTFKIACER